MRHGESTSNAEGILYGKDAPLTEKGKEQAHAVARRFVHIPIDIVLSSDYPRAYDTAEAIAAATQREHIVYPHLHEKSLPATFVGRSRDDSERVQAHEAYLRSWRAGVRDYRISDEENFEDLLARARTVKEYLNSREEQRIAAVTHGNFLKFFHSYVMFGDALTPDMSLTVQAALASSNTGVTIYEVHTNVRYEWEGNWKLRTWMDIAHLGE